MAPGRRVDGGDGYRDRVQTGPLSELHSGVYSSQPYRGSDSIRPSKNVTLVLNHPLTGGRPSRVPDIVDLSSGHRSVVSVVVSPGTTLRTEGGFCLLTLVPFSRPLRRSQCLLFVPSRRSWDTSSYYKLPKSHCYT